MKRLFILGFIAAALLTSCDNKTKDQAQQELEAQQALNEATREELQTAISERDELLDMINEITANVEDIKNAEKVITINGGGEMTSKTELTNNLAAIKATLADRRQKLAALEAKLKDSKLSNTKLLETIESLRKQIDDQEAQIASLTTQLENANRRIGDLTTSVENLNSTVQTVTEERDAAQEEAVAQANLANECWFAIGSKKELKDHNILESGFLRKTKIMQGDFDKTFFTKADKRTLRSIQLHSKKAKIVTSAQPANSYDIVEVDGQMVLNILNPSEFWGVSNYVVIQID